MSGAVDTPAVTVKLDDSERIRFEKLRNKLLLTEWTKIKSIYDIYPDEDAAKKIRELKISDPVLHDELFSDWENRFSDLSVHWQKKRDNDGILYGSLIASGRLRFEGLGNISEGCSLTLMRGPLKTDPLPVTKVTPLRVNHLNMTVEFATIVTRDNPDHVTNRSTSFKVGRDNFLYGEAARVDNLEAAKQKKSKKQELQTKDMLNTLVETFVKLATDSAKNVRRPEETEPTEDGADGQDPGPLQRSSAGSHARYPSHHGGEFEFGSQPYHNIFDSPEERQDCIDLAKKFTMGNKTPSSSFPQSQPGINDQKSPKHSEAVGGTGASTPDTEDTDGNSQVTFSTPTTTGTQTSPSSLTSSLTPSLPQQNPRYKFRQSTIDKSSTKERTNILETSFKDLRTKNNKRSKSVLSKHVDKST